MDAISYVGKCVIGKRSLVGVSMSSPTLLNLANFGRALVSRNSKAPSIQVCTEFFATATTLEIQAVITFICICVPKFHPRLLDLYMESVLMKADHPNYKPYFRSL